MLLKSTEKHGKHTGELSRKVKFLCICNRAHFVPDCVCPYAEIKRATCFPYNEQPDLKEYRKVCVEFLKIAHPRVLADRAEHGDGEAYLELGLMYDISMVIFPSSCAHLGPFTQAHRRYN